MIPGTLRPLPKKLKETKIASDKLLRIIYLDIQKTDEIYSDSSTFTFEEINNQYLNINNQLASVNPLEKEADKLVTKYVNDYLLNEFVYNIYRKLAEAQTRLQKDSQRLDTILMLKRKKHIEEMLPRLKDEIKRKLSFLKDLSFDEVLEKSQIYGNTISDIIGKLEALKDEYAKLTSGSFDVTEFYGYLRDKIAEVEDELVEYDLILRTCRMQLLSEEAEKLIEEGNVIVNEIEINQSSELILKGDQFISTAAEKLEQINSLKVHLPRKGISKEFSNKFKTLQQQFEANKIGLMEIRTNLTSKTILLGSQIERINGIKEIAQSDGEEIYEAISILKIKKKGAFKLIALEGNLPVFELSPLKKLKMPLGVDLTNEHIEILLTKIEEIETTPFFRDLGDRFKTLKIAEILERTGIWFKRLWAKILPVLKKIWNAIVKASLEVVKFFKNLFSKDKKVKPAKEKTVEVQKEPEAESEVESEIQEFPDAEQIPEPPS
jgi:ribosomal protein S4